VFSGDYERKRSNRTFKAHAGHWAGVENPETGRCLALISSAQEVEMDDWGTDGGHLCWMPEHTVPAHGHAEKRAFIVIVNDREEARRFAALKDIYEE
jgi:hypothetical protein